MSPSSTGGECYFHRGFPALGGGAGHPLLLSLIGVGLQPKSHGSPDGNCPSHVPGQLRVLWRRSARPVLHQLSLGPAPRPEPLRPVLPAGAWARGSRPRLRRLPNQPATVLPCARCAVVCISRGRCSQVVQVRTCTLLCSCIRGVALRRVSAQFSECGCPGSSAAASLALRDPRLQPGRRTVQAVEPRNGTSNRAQRKAGSADAAANGAQRGGAQAEPSWRICRFGEAPLSISPDRGRRYDHGGDLQAACPRAAKRGCSDRWCSYGRSCCRTLNSPLLRRYSVARPYCCAPN